MLGNILRTCFPNAVSFPHKFPAINPENSAKYEKETRLKKNRDKRTEGISVGTKLNENERRIE